MTAEKTGIEGDVDEWMREHQEGVRLRELERAAREARLRRLAAKRRRENEERRPVSRAKKATVCSEDAGGTSMSAQRPRTWRPMP